LNYSIKHTTLKIAGKSQVCEACEAFHVLLRSPGLIAEALTICVQLFERGTGPKTLADVTEIGQEVTAISQGDEKHNQY
jgi:hypothetical protein